MLEAAGIPVSEYIAFNYAERELISFSAVKNKLGLPFMVKAASLGSSVGVSKVNSEDDFITALEDAFRYDEQVIMERYIKGREIECAILGNYPPQASYPGEIIISDKYEFYTFDAKYVDSEAVQIKVPAELDKDIAEKIRELSVKAFKTLHCQDFARVDLFVDGDDNIYVNEINTIPGFTNSSMYPVMWKERGISFRDLITSLIELALDRYQQNKRIERDFQSTLKF